MEALKVLIADDNPVMRTLMAELISMREEVALVETAQNGHEVLEKLAATKFDVLVMDVILQRVDGFGVMESLSGSQDPPRIIIVSALSQEEIIRKACDCGAAYYMVKPIDIEALCNRVVDTPYTVHSSAPQPRQQRSAVKSLDERVANIFITAGIPAHIKGYHFLREAVKQVYAKRTMINAITKELYPAVAATFGTTHSKVERAIRHAIEVAWNRGKIENINSIFGYTVYTRNEKPTNGEFIALVADKLQLEDMTQKEQQSIA